MFKLMNKKDVSYRRSGKEREKCVRTKYNDQTEELRTGRTEKRKKFGN